MDSLRKILLINVLGLAIIFVAFSSYAGMGGGHHMQSYGGNVIDMPNRNNPDKYMNHQQFNHNPEMHNESGRKNQNDHSFQEDMMHNNLQERNSSNPNNDKIPGTDMNHQSYQNGPGRN